MFQSVFRALFTAALLFSASGPACAANIQTSDAGSMHGVAVLGEIRSGDYEAFAQALEAAMRKSQADKKTAVVFLNSGGGEVYEAEKMAALIKKLQPAVLVTKTSTCASACFLLFLTTPNKFAYHGARIGVHSVSIDGGQQNVGTKAVTINFARFAKMNGAPDSVVGKLVTTDPNDIKFLSDNELHLMGVTFLDDDNIDQRERMAPPPSAEATSSPNDQVQAKYEEQNRAFANYWNEKLALSKAQHNGRVAYERRCSSVGCSDVIAYFDKKRRYVEAWKQDGTSKKLVCREDRYYGQLTCTDWYDGHQFNITYTHRIGSDMYEDDIFDIFK